MLAKKLPDCRPCRIPAECYNLARLVGRASPTGSVALVLPGLSDNVLTLDGRHWSCWNRRLEATLLSWDAFRQGARRSLLDPVDCTLTVHHSYSRTIIHRVYDSLIERLRRELAGRRAAPGRATLHAWPGGVAGPSGG